MERRGRGVQTVEHVQAELLRVHIQRERAVQEGETGMMADYFCLSSFSGSSGFSGYKTKEIIMRKQIGPKIEKVLA